MIEPTDFEELFALLNAHEARYLVIGGYAVAVHARPRFTDDLDLLVPMEPDDVQRLCAALAEFGYGPPHLTSSTFFNPDRLVQIGVPPYRVDILTSILGVEFEAAWEGRFVGRYGNQEVTFMGRRDLISAKEAAGRPQDLEDLRVLRIAERYKPF
jgi:hypothetical protein